MAPWRNGSVSVLHTEGGGSIPPGATRIIIMSNKKTINFYLGDIPDNAISTLKHMVEKKNMDLFKVMKKFNLGDPNRIYIANKLFKNEKIKWNQVILGKEQ